MDYKFEEFFSQVKPFFSFYFPDTYELVEFCAGNGNGGRKFSQQPKVRKITFVDIKKVRDLGKEVFVATNTLEQMAFALKPSKGEVNDIINTILDGATGIALTKETAVGKYPVETVNTLLLLLNQIRFLDKSKKENLIDKLEELNYALSLETPDLLPKPHGGKLINRLDSNYPGPIPEKKLEVDEETLMDVEQIAIGAFSPLEGFMNKEELNSVADNMKLPNGLVWPIPIVLMVDEDVRKNLSQGEEVALSYNNEVYGIMHLDEIYSVDKEKIAEKVYGTTDRTHPGVRMFLDKGNNFLGGKVTLLKRRNSKNKIYELTPHQTRKIFAERGWSKVLGFHTRNVIHKSHEFIQLEGMKKGLCDGLLVHPVIGKKKSGDFESEVIINAYEKMIEEFYPKSLVILGTFATYSRYCGPREAVFTALARKNFGCSHFIIGRDHTGVENFYHPNMSHKIFDNFTKEELGIEPIKFDKVFYSDLENDYIHESEFLDHPEEHKLHISGTQAREILQSGKQLPNWFMRPEISKMIIEKIKNGEKVFVD